MLLHLRQNVITFRTLLHLGQNVIRIRTITFRPSTRDFFARRVVIALQATVENTRLRMRNKMLRSSSVK